MRSKWVIKFISNVFQLLIMLILPFLLLIRGAVALYEGYGWHFFPSLLVMMCVVGLILLVYLAMIWDAIFGPNKITRRSIKAKLVLVTILILYYAGYMMFSLSAGNAKGETVREEFQSLHPFLRLSVGTFVWLDKDVLITDVSRKGEDYRKMGLKKPQHSLHYKQSTGFVHAMDLRTIGRSELRNFLLATYFNILGFNTLRHVGTADHLHISLPIRSDPSRI